jgi:DNA-binding CsgD family transcriptional regulator
MGLLLVCFGIWRWIIQARRAKQKQQLHQQNLADLTRILLEKNALLINMEESMAAQNIANVPQAEQPDFESDLYNQQILTDSDWSSFKGYFEKAHPGYIQRLRTAFPTITNAEKRLFLLLKINLNTKEAATMLGISAESVKKTRTRLRKRLGLGEEAALEEFVHSF